MFYKYQYVIQINYMVIPSFIGKTWTYHGVKMDLLWTYYNEFPYPCQEKSGMDTVIKECTLWVTVDRFRY